MNRKMNFYQTATVLFVLAFTSLENGVTGQCMVNPSNIAVDEGSKDVFLPCAPNPTQVNWYCYPTSDELESADLNDERSVAAANFKDMFQLEATGMRILEATIFEKPNSFCTAGIWLGLHGNETRLVGAKIIVVRVPGLVCKINVASPSNGVPIKITCTTTYADHSVHPVRPIYEVKVGDDIFFYGVIYPERINQHVFVAEKVFELDYNACLAIVITLTFDQPTDLQYPFMATNKPDYTRTFRIEATSDDCLRDVLNVALFEGAENVYVGSSRNPVTLERKISSTSNQLETYAISDFENGVLSNMTKYYVQDKRGLIISKVTAVAGPNELATGGIYTEKDRTGGLRGYKVIVVRGPPVCSSSLSVANPPMNGDSIQLTCTAQFCDHALHGIASRMTLKRNGTPRNTVTPQRKINDDNSYSVTATFTVAYEAAADLTCEFSFDPPPSDDGFSYMASNAPSISASCRF